MAQSVKICTCLEFMESSKKSSAWNWSLVTTYSPLSILLGVANPMDQIQTKPSTQMCGIQACQLQKLYFKELNQWPFLPQVPA